MALLLFGSSCPNDSMSATLCGCYMILLFMCNDFKNLLHYAASVRACLAWYRILTHFLRSVSTDVLLNVWLSDDSTL